MENKVPVVLKKEVPVKKQIVKSVTKEVPVKKEVAVEKEIIKPVEKISITNVQDVLKIVGNKDFFEIYSLINSMDSKFFLTGFNGTFNTKKEVSLFFQERVFDFLKSRYADIKSNISHLRKKGFKVGDIDLKALSIPLKTKMLLPNFTLNDFLKIKEIMDFVESSLAEFKVED